MEDKFEVIAYEKSGQVWKSKVVIGSDMAVKTAKVFRELGILEGLSGRVLIRAGGEWIAGYSFGVIPFGWQP